MLLMSIFTIPGAFTLSPYPADKHRHQQSRQDGQVVIKRPRTLREEPLPTRGLIMCAAGGIRNLAAPTAMARLLHEEFKLSWPLELYFTQAEADAEPRFAPVVANWTSSMRAAGMVVKVHTLRSKGSRFECKLSGLLSMAWECSPQGTGNASLVPFSPGERGLLRARTHLGVYG